MARQRFQRGSEWRKWDFHIHAPGTKKNDNYRSATGEVWADFCKKTEESDVMAFGIADYFSADSYLDFMKRFREVYPDSVKLFLPNIELCTSDVVNGAGEEVNLHVVFNPEYPHIEDRMKEFLRNLQTNKTVQSGKHVAASELSTKSDFEAATTTREFIEEAFKNTFGGKVDLTEALLVFTAVNNDGLRTATEMVDGRRRGKKRKAIITDELDKFSHGFFGNSNNTAHFLNGDRLEGSEKTDPKPVVSGSDAHSFSDFDNWVGKMVLKSGSILKESTWIKADLTFEGLRQIIFEPEQRVFVGEEPDIEIHVRTEPRRYLESVHISHIDGYDGRCGTWFVDEQIPLNKELVAIIGNKGSGKSALTDIIGLVGNSHNQRYEHSNAKSEELFSFLNDEKFRKGHCASGFSATLSWCAGEPNSAVLDSDTDGRVLERVEYLPQKYLEKICANIEDDEFRHKLNEVIFEYVERKDRYDTENLEDLIKYLTTQTQEDIQAAKEKLHSENESVLELEKKLTADHKKDIEERIRQKEEEVKAHIGAEPQAVPPPNEGDAATKAGTVEISKIDAELSALDGQIENLRAEQITSSTYVEDLRQLRQALQRQQDALGALETKYQATLKAVGMKLSDMITVSVTYEKLDEIISERQNRLAGIEALLLSESDIDDPFLETSIKEEAAGKSLVCQRTKLKERKSEIVDKLDKPNRDYQAYLKTKNDWEARKKALEGEETEPEENTLNWLKQERVRIDSAFPEKLRSARSEREVASRVIFEKKKSLVVFYESVKRAIDKEIKKYGKELGDYDIVIEASLRLDPLSLCDGFFRFVSQSVKGSFYGASDGKAVLKRIFDAVDDWEDVERVFSALRDVVNHLDFDKRPDSPSHNSSTGGIIKQLKQNRDPVDFYDFLYGFDYVDAKYDLEVDGKDLSELSPGERGGVLLIFYLMLDTRRIPLVIDQPEDNLDNKSVYEILVRFLKKAKKRRQIIIATHNPNLAVVADAEQIIHVTIDKRNRNDFAFYSGSIENPKINKEVVNILEGTLPAFDNRRLKYRKQKSHV